MKPPSNPGEVEAPALPPNWLPQELRRFFVPEPPRNSQPVAGSYVQSEKWMLENHAADMLKGRSAWVIAPMFNGVGTYRLSGK
jgi:hypothetical protein